MANLSNINNILRISSSGVGLNKDNTGPSELDIESAGADMIDMTRTGQKTYRFAISGASAFSLFDVAANADRLTINSAGNATFAGDVTLGSWLKGSSGTNAFYSATSYGTLLNSPTNSGAGANIYFRNSTGTVFQTFSQSDGSATFAGRVTVEATSAVTNGIVDTLVVKALSSGAITNGFGVGLSFYNENTVYSAVNEVGKIAVVETDTIAIDDKMVFYVKDNNTLAERLTLNGSEAIFTGKITQSVSSGGTAASFTNSDATNGYGVAIQSEGTSNTRYALVLRNLDSSNIYGGVSTMTNQVGFWGIGASPIGTLGSRLTVGGNASIGTSYTGTAAPSNGLIVQGNVGIGTSDPVTKLELKSPTVGSITNDRETTTSAFVINGSNENMSLQFGLGNSALNYGNWIQSGYDNGTPGSSPLYLNPIGGNVGIGTVSPAEKLHVVGSQLITGGVATSVSGEALRVSNPGGASWGHQTSPTGAIKITLPQSWTNTMMRMTVKIYEYAADESFEVELGGYNVASGTSWVNTFAHIISSAAVDRNFTVRFGHDGTYCAIYIGELTSSWTYPQVAVTNFEAGFSQYNADKWIDGWDIGTVTSFGTISSTETSTQVTNWARNGQDLYYGSGSGNVGIGITGPVVKLHVVDTTTLVGAFVSNNTTRTELAIDNTSTNNVRLGLKATPSGAIIDSTNHYGSNVQPLIFQLNAVEKMRITSAGDVLINRTARANGYDSGFKTLSVASNLNEKASIIELIGTRSEGGNQNGMLQFYTDRVTLTQTAGITGLTGTGTNGYLAGELSFLTKTTTGNLIERMRVTTAGAIEVRNGSIICGEVKNSGADNDFTLNGQRGQIVFQIAGTNKMALDANQLYPEVDNTMKLGLAGQRWSIVYAVSGVNTSDETLKENIKECDLGIDFIDSLKPKSYNLKDLKEDNDAYGKKRYGLIAQDLLETELKDSVFGKKDGEYGLSYNDLIAPMIKAIQELKADNDSLKARIETLENN